MDSILGAAARALAGGDALGALNRVALRDDPAALALRGIAMAQLGEHARARKLLQLAARGFRPHERVARARCVVADAEVALAMRELGSPARRLASAAAVLDANGDRANALLARLTAARQSLILGRLDEAARELDSIDPRGTPPLLAAVIELARAELALRSMKTGVARASLARATDFAAIARVPALQAEVAEAKATLDRIAARRVSRGSQQPLRLDEAAVLLESGAFVVDACRRGIRVGTRWLPLSRRPILFTLARALAEHWPDDVPREVLVERAFNARRQNETHRARLRVEIGRLRALVKEVAGIEATDRGFAIAPRMGSAVVVLAPPIDGDNASIVALLSDGCAWSTSSVALALDASQRTVQRALGELGAQGKVRSLGKARAKRWLAPPLTGFTTNLLLPLALPAA